MVFGNAKVEEAIAKAKVAALIHASDAAEDGCRKLEGKLRARRKGRRCPARWPPFSADELGLASGRENVIHAALIQGGAARTFLAGASRAERYRKGQRRSLCPAKWIGHGQGMSEINETEDKTVRGGRKMTLKCVGRWRPATCVRASATAAPSPFWSRRRSAARSAPRLRLSRAEEPKPKRRHSSTRADACQA